MFHNKLDGRIFAWGLALSLGITQSAGARANLINGVVDQWTVDVYTIFDTKTVQTIDVTSTPSELRWGNNNLGNGFSGLVITNSPSTKTVNTNGPAVENISITHENRTMQDQAGDSVLQSVTILSSLALTPLVPVGGKLDFGIAPFYVRFNETPNEPMLRNPPSNFCADGGEQGTGINNPGCADIFVTNTDGMMIDFPYDLDGAGPLPLRWYHFSFSEVTQGLNTLSPEACLSTTGSALPCMGFETREAKDTTLTFAVRITTDIEPDNHVPEPGSLALVGVALAALGVARSLAG